MGERDRHKRKAERREEGWGDEEDEETKRRKGREEGEREGGLRHTVQGCKGRQ